MTAEEIRKKILEFAASLRAELKWNRPGWYATDAEIAKCDAKEDIYTDIANTLEGLFNE
jgi:hypothetical protein